MRYGRRTIVQIEEELEIEETDTPPDDWEEYKIVKEVSDDDDEVLNTHYVRSRFIELDTADYVISDDPAFGEFPYNIVQQNDKYDIDVEITTETGQSQAGILSASVSIYNPPKNLRNNILIPRSGRMIGKNIEISADHKKTIIIKSGYYGVDGDSLPIIYSGTIDDFRYTYEDTQVVLELNAVSQPEVNSLVTSGTFSGYFGEVIYNICGASNVSVGYIPERINVKDKDMDYVFFYEGELEEDEEYAEITVEIDDVMPVFESCLKATKELRDNYFINLDVSSDMGSINIFPSDFARYSGLQLTPESGLISLDEKSDLGADLLNILDGLDIDETEFKNMQDSGYTLECLFLPEISYGDFIKFRMNEQEDWRYIRINSYQHDIPSNGEAKTTIEGESETKVDEIDTMYETHSLKSINPYKLDQNIYDVYSLTE